MLLRTLVDKYTHSGGSIMNWAKNNRLEMLISDSWIFQPKHRRSFCFLRIPLVLSSQYSFGFLGMYYVHVWTKHHYRLVTFVFWDLCMFSYVVCTQKEIYHGGVVDDFMFLFHTSPPHTLTSFTPFSSFIFSLLFHGMLLE